MPTGGFHQQGTDLPYGSSTQLDEALDVAASAPSTLPGASADATALPQVFAPQGGTDQVDAEIFAPTDFPNRPLTGGRVLPGPKPSDRTILYRAASRIVEMKDSLPEADLAWAWRALNEG